MILEADRAIQFAGRALKNQLSRVNIHYSHDVAIIPLFAVGICAVTHTSRRLTQVLESKVRNLAKYIGLVSVQSGMTCSRADAAGFLSAVQSYISIVYQCFFIGATRNSACGRILHLVNVRYQEAY